MQLAGQPVLPKIEAGKEESFFSTKTFIRHGLVLVAQKCAHLGGICGK